jgi:D-cysteine desulfhydrase
MVAAEEGVMLDPIYSGKAFHGMLEEIKLGRYDQEKDIVFVHTGGIFGLLAQQDQLQF